MPTNFPTTAINLKLTKKLYKYKKKIKIKNYIHVKETCEDNTYPRLPYHNK